MTYNVFSGTLNPTHSLTACTDQKKCTTTQNKQKTKKPGLVTSYDIRPGNREDLFLFWRFINLSFTYLQYLDTRLPHGAVCQKILSQPCN